jgi:hypothetical protein
LRSRGGGGASFGGATGGTTGGGGAGLGGAVFNMQGELTIRNSTLTGNTAAGGADVVPDDAKGIGGGVFNLNGTFSAVGSTFAANTALWDCASICNVAWDGVTPFAATTTLQSTIVAGGVTNQFDLASSKAPTVFVATNKASAHAEVGGFNLVTRMGTYGDGTTNGTPLTADPLLGALADNGGPTQTMAPAAGSPVIDAGASFGLTTDQRGLSRPFDLGAIPNASDGADIGAVELTLPLTRPNSGPRLAFGPRTLVTLALAKKRIPAKGPIRVVISNRNGFAVNGKLSGQTAKKVSVSARRKPNKRLKLNAKSFNVSASAKKTVTLKLSKGLRGLLKRKRTLDLRLMAKVTDPAGNTRTVKKKVTPKLKGRKR